MFKININVKIEMNLCLCYVYIIMFNIKNIKTNKFIEKAKQIHGDKYDYSKVDYINAKTKITIICKIHGDFLQTPNNHLCGQSCSQCGKISSSNKQKSNTVEFIEKAKQTHGDKYDYSKVEYTKAINKIIIICKIHGEFIQKAITHITGSGCSKCSGVYSYKTDEFIEKAKKTHNDKYDYSKVVYTNIDNKVIITCKIHGEFLQTPYCHFKGAGCSKCSGTYNYTTEEFIEKTKEKHGDKYDYSKVNYISGHNKIIIICKTHGEFIQEAKSHLRGANCIKCVGNYNNTTEEFVEKARKIHGDIYDYSKVDYTNTSNNIIIICKIHGEFLQTPNNHLRGKKCSKCSGVYSCTTEEFIEKCKEIHGDKYDYSKTNYTKTSDKIIIICKEHGDFSQVASSHLTGNGCSKCSGTYSYTTEEFVEKARKIHGDIYDYSKTIYTKADDKVIIICKIHGEFLQTPSKHANTKRGCPLCVNKTEGKLYNKLQPFYPSIIQQFKQDWCKNILCLPYDFCIPEYNIIIELDGLQHFQQVRDWKSPEEQLQTDKYKEKCANDNNFSSIRILQEDVFYDTYDWCKKLCDVIEEIKNGDEIVNVYLCKNDEY